MTAITGERERMGDETPATVRPVRGRDQPGRADMPKRTADPYKLCHQLSCLDLPHNRDEPPVRNADEMLRMIVDGVDFRGRYFGEPELLRRLFWWQPTPTSTVTQWMSELIERGDLILEMNAAPSCYGGNHSIITVTRRARFPRWARASRPAIPSDVRRQVYERDEGRCVACAATDDLTLDHIHPWSLGGTDDLDNLQTMCRPCNSRKGARI